MSPLGRKLQLSPFSLSQFFSVFYLLPPLGNIKTSASTTNTIKASQHPANFSVAISQHYWAGPVSAVTPSVPNGPPLTGTGTCNNSGKGWAISFVCVNQERGDIVKLEHKINKSSQIKMTSVWCQFTADYPMSLEAWRGTFYANVLMKNVFSNSETCIWERANKYCWKNKCCQPQKQQFTTDYETSKKMNSFSFCLFVTTKISNKQAKILECKWMYCW